jgi:SNF2 family DNA or RNA helicase
MHIADVDIKFEFLICDEANVLRDPRRRTSRACMMVNAVSTVMITATPMLNQVDDISGLMMQGWRRATFYESAWSMTVL